MKLLINNEPVDLELQGEQTAFEVVRQLDAWLAEQGHALAGLNINGQVRDLSADDWRSMALSDVETLAVEAPTQHQLRLANLSLLNEFAENLNTSLIALADGKATLPAILQTIANYPALRPTLAYLGEDQGKGNAENDPFFQETDRLFAAAHHADGSFNAAILPQLARQVHALSLIHISQGIVR